MARRNGRGKLNSKNRVEKIDKVPQLKKKKEGIVETSEHGKPQTQLDIEISKIVSSIRRSTRISKLQTANETCANTSSSSIEHSFRKNREKFSTISKEKVSETDSASHSFQDYTGDSIDRSNVGNTSTDLSPVNKDTISQTIKPSTMKNLSSSNNSEEIIKDASLKIENSAHVGDKGCKKFKIEDVTDGKDKNEVILDETNTLSSNISLGNNESHISEKINVLPKDEKLDSFEDHLLPSYNMLNITDSYKASERATSKENDEMFLSIRKSADESTDRSEINKISAYEDQSNCGELNLTLEKAICKEKDEMFLSIDKSVDESTKSSGIIISAYEGQSDCGELNSTSGKATCKEDDKSTGINKISAYEGQSDCGELNSTSEKVACKEEDEMFLSTNKSVDESTEISGINKICTYKDQSDCGELNSTSKNRNKSFVKNSKLLQSKSSQIIENVDKSSKEVAAEVNKITYSESGMLGVNEKPNSLLEGNASVKDEIKDNVIGSSGMKERNEIETNKVNICKKEGTFKEDTVKDMTVWEENKSCHIDEINIKAEIYDVEDIQSLKFSSHIESNITDDEKSGNSNDFLLSEDLTPLENLAVGDITNHQSKLLSQNKSVFDEDMKDGSNTVIEGIGNTEIKSERINASEHDESFNIEDKAIVNLKNSLTTQSLEPLINQDYTFTTRNEDTSSSNSTKQKIIPGSTYILTFKNTTKEKKIINTYDCVLCNPSKCQNYNSMEMKTHLKTRDHLLNVMQMDHCTLYEKFKDDETVSPSVLFKELCKFGKDTNIQILTTKQAYDMKRKTLVKNISHLTNEANRKMGSRCDSESSELHHKDIKIETHTYDMAFDPQKLDDFLSTSRLNATRDRSLINNSLKSSSADSMLTETHIISPVENKIACISKEKKHDVEELPSEKPLSHELQKDSVSDIFQQPNLEKRIFEKIVIVTDPRYSEYMDKFKNSKIDVLVSDLSDTISILSYIRAQMKSQPERTLWLYPTGVFSVVNMIDSELCIHSSSGCANPLRVILPDQKILEESEDPLLSIQNDIFALMKEVNEILNRGSSFLILPPIPPTLLKFVEKNHYLYHTIDAEQKMLYISSPEDIQNFVAKFTELSKRMIFSTLCELKKFNISEHYFEVYNKVSETWSNHVKMLSYEMLVNNSYLTEKYNKWFETIENFMCDCLTSRETTKSDATPHSLNDFDKHLEDKCPGSNLQSTFKSSPVALVSSESNAAIDKQGKQNILKEYDHIVCLGYEDQFELLPTEQEVSYYISTVDLKNSLDFKKLKAQLDCNKSLEYCKNILFIIFGSVKFFMNEFPETSCKKMKCVNPISYFNMNLTFIDELVQGKIKDIRNLLFQINNYYSGRFKVLLIPIFPVTCAVKSAITETSHEDLHDVLGSNKICLLLGQKFRWDKLSQIFKMAWEEEMFSELFDSEIQFNNIIKDFLAKPAATLIWQDLQTFADVSDHIPMFKLFLKSLVAAAIPSLKLKVPIPLTSSRNEGIKSSENIELNVNAVDPIALFISSVRNNMNIYPEDQKVNSDSGSGNVKEDINTTNQKDDDSSVSKIIKPKVVGAKLKKVDLPLHVVTQGIGFFTHRFQTKTSEPDVADYDVQNAESDVDDASSSDLNVEVSDVKKTESNADVSSTEINLKEYDMNYSEVGNNDFATKDYAMNYSDIGSNDLATKDYTMNYNETGSNNLATKEYSMNYSNIGNNNLAIKEYTMNYSKIGSNNLATKDYTMNYSEIDNNNSATKGYAMNYSEIGSSDLATKDYAANYSEIGSNDLATKEYAMNYNEIGINDLATKECVMNYSEIGRNDLATKDYAMNCNEIVSSRLATKECTINYDEIGSNDLATNNSSSENTKQDVTEVVVSESKGSNLPLHLSQNDAGVVVSESESKRLPLHLSQNVKYAAFIARKNNDEKHKNKSKVEVSNVKDPEKKAKGSKGMIDDVTAEQQLTFALDITSVQNKSREIPFEHAYIVGNIKADSILCKNIFENIEYIKYDLTELSENDIPALIKTLGTIKNNSICFLVFNLPAFTNQIHVTYGCKNLKCKDPISCLGFNIYRKNELLGVNAFVVNKVMELMSVVTKLSVHLPVIVLPVFPASIHCDDDASSYRHKMSHASAKTGSYIVNGKKENWEAFANILTSVWNNFVKMNYEKYFSSTAIEKYMKDEFKLLVFEDGVKKYSALYSEVAKWESVSQAFLKILLLNFSEKYEEKLMGTVEESPKTIPNVFVVVWNFLPASESKIFDTFKEMEPNSLTHRYNDYLLIEVPRNKAGYISQTLDNLKMTNDQVKSCVIGEDYFVLMHFKTQLCDGSCKGEHHHCYFFHDIDDKRRNPVTNTVYNYNPVICSFPKAVLGECTESGSSCTLSHNSFENDFHPTKYQMHLCPAKKKSLCKLQPYCSHAHQKTPEMFYNKNWKDLVTFGSENSLTYLIGAIRGLTKLPPMQKGKILFLSQSLKFLNAVKSIMMKILRDFNVSNVRPIILDERVIESDCYNVFLSTPSALFDVHQYLFTSGDWKALIVDDVTTMVKDSNRKLLLLLLKLKLKDSLGINKVFVSENYDAETTEHLRKLFEIPLKEVRGVESDASSIGSRSPSKSPDRSQFHDKVRNRKSRSKSRSRKSPVRFHVKSLGNVQTRFPMIARGKKSPVTSRRSRSRSRDGRSPIISRRSRSSSRDRRSPVVSRRSRSRSRDRRSQVISRRSHSRSRDRRRPLMSKKFRLGSRDRRSPIISRRSRSRSRDRRSPIISRRSRSRSRDRRSPIISRRSRSSSRDRRWSQMTRKSRSISRDRRSCSRSQDGRSPLCRKIRSRSRGRRLSPISRRSPSRSRDRRSTLIPKRYRSRSRDRKSLIISKRYSSGSRDRRSTLGSRKFLRSRDGRMVQVCRRSRSRSQDRRSQLISRRSHSRSRGQKSHSRSREIKTRSRSRGRRSLSRSRGHKSRSRSQSRRSHSRSRDQQTRLKSEEKRFHSSSRNRQSHSGSREIRSRSKSRSRRSSSRARGRKSRSTSRTPKCSNFDQNRRSKGSSSKSKKPRKDDDLENIDLNRESFVEVLPLLSTEPSKKRSLSSPSPQKPDKKKSKTKADSPLSRDMTSSESKLTSKSKTSKQKLNIESSEGKPRESIDLQKDESEQSDPLAPLLGEDLYKEFLNEKKKISVLHEEEYEVYANFPDLHLNYATYFKAFCSEYVKQIGDKKGDKRRDSCFKEFWKQNIGSIKEKELVLKLDKLLRHYKLKAGDFDSQTETSSVKAVGHSEEEASSVEAQDQETSFKSSDETYSSKTSASLSSLEVDESPLESERKDSSSSKSHRSSSSSKSHKSHHHHPSRKLDETPPLPASSELQSSSSKEGVETIVAAVASTSDEFKLKCSSESSNTGDCMPKKFSVDGALSLLEQVSSKLGMLGPAMLTIVKSARKLGTDSKEAMKVFTEEENNLLLQLGVDKLKSIESSAPQSEMTLLSKCIKWITYLLKYAESPQPKFNLNLNAIATSSLNKTSDFTLNLIKTAFVYEGNINPTKEELYDAYFKICSLHVEMSSGSH